MPRCFVCGEKIDDIGFNAGKGKGFICDECHSKCSIHTQMNIESIGKDDIIEEVLKYEVKSAERTPIDKKNRQVRSANRYAWIMLIVILLLMLTFSFMSPKSQNAEIQEQHFATMQSAVFSL